MRPRPDGGATYVPWAKDGDRGSGSVLALAVAGLVAVVLAGGLVVAAVALAGQQARTAADLAALAAMGGLTGGTTSAEASSGSPGSGTAAPSSGSVAGTGASGPACGLAARVAERNGATLVECSAHGPGAMGPEVAAAVPVIEVVVERQVLGTPWTVRAVAAATAVPER